MSGSPERILILAEPAVASAICHAVPAEASVDVAPWPFEPCDPGVFAQQVVTAHEHRWSLVIATAQVVDGQSWSLSLLEHLLSVRPARTVLLSFQEHPIRESRGERLVASAGETLLDWAGMVQVRLPTTAATLRCVIKAWLTPAPLDFAGWQGQLREALHAGVSADVRHRRANEQAALRMLESSRVNRYCTQVEYESAIEALRVQRPDGEQDWQVLLGRLGELTWSSADNRPDARRSVLLIDDQAESAVWAPVLQPLCRSVGAELTWETTLKAGLDRLRGDKPPDAVLLDLHLGPCDPQEPFEVLRRVRVANDAVPVIVFTTEHEGRFVRDLARDSFHYFFKQDVEASTVNLPGYAASFCRHLQEAIQSGVAWTAVSLVRQFREMSELSEDRVWLILEQAARTLTNAGAGRVMYTPEVSLSLLAGGLAHLRSRHYDRFGILLDRHWDRDAEAQGWYAGNLIGYRRLFHAVRACRNYTMHQEDAEAPAVHPLDAVVQLIGLCVLALELEQVYRVGPDVYSGPVQWPDAQQKRIAQLIGRLVVGAVEGLSTRQVATGARLNHWKHARTSFKNGQQLARWHQADLRALMRFCGRDPQFPVHPGPGTGPLPAFALFLGNWLPACPPGSEWRWRGEPYFAFACRFLLLERVVQMPQEEWDLLTEACNRRVVSTPGSQRPAPAATL